MKKSLLQSIANGTAPAAVFSILVMAITALPFLPALGYGFVYDDDAAIVNNGYLQSWRGALAYFLPSAMRSNSPGVSANAYNTYRPFFYLWLRLNDVLFGLNPIGWHATSLCVHLLATLVVFFVLKRHFPNQWIATAGALIFGVHPVHIETVVWVSSATDSFMTLGIIASLLLWLRATEYPSAALKLASLACYAAALLFKETGVILAPMVFVYLFVETNLEGGKESFSARFRRAIWGTLPFVGVTVLYLITRTLSLSSTVSRKPWIAGVDVLKTQPSLLLFYLRHLAWPMRLSVFYDLVPVLSLRDSHFWLPLLVLGVLALCGLQWWRITREMAIPVAFAWLFIPLVPVLNIAFFQKQDFAHDRYLYLPCLGLAIICCSLLKLLIGASAAPHRQYLAFGLAPALIVALACSTAVQATPWHDDFSLYSYALQRSSNSGARNNLASEYATRGRYEEANALLGPLVKEEPDSWLANYNFGYVNYRLKHLDVAEQFLRRAIAVDPHNGDEFTYLGLTHLREGRIDEAAAELSEAIKWDPSAEGNHLALGVVRLQQHDTAAAKAQFLEELNRHPNSQAALQQLAAMDSARNVQPALPVTARQ